MSTNQNVRGSIPYCIIGFSLVQNYAVSITIDKEAKYYNQEEIGQV